MKRLKSTYENQFFFKSYRSPCALSNTSENYIPKITYQNYIPTSFEIYTPKLHTKHSVFNFFPM